MKLKRNSKVTVQTFDMYLLLLTAAKSLQSCPTLCDPIDGSPPGSPVPGILQARTLEWAAISFSNVSKSKVKVKSLSHVQLFTTPWTAAYQAPLPMGFSRQGYWSGLPLPYRYVSIPLKWFSVCMLPAHSCNQHFCNRHILKMVLKVNWIMFKRIFIPLPYMTTFLLFWLILKTATIPTLFLFFHLLPFFSFQACYQFICDTH